MARKPGYDTALIERAFSFLERAVFSLRSLRSETREKILEHNLRVSNYIIEFFPEPNTIVSALLHNAFTILGIKEQEIKLGFGDVVAKIITDYNALVKISDDAHNIIIEREFINFFISKTDSFPSLFISFANRIVMLENITNGRYPKAPEKSRAIAYESIRIYAAIANILGIWRVKALLEDLSFQILHPEEFSLIHKSVEGGMHASDSTLSEVTEIISRKLKENGILDFELSFRRKHLYSIYLKTKRKETDLDFLYDINGIRIILSTNEDCFSAMGVIIENFEDIPIRTKDFISNPKPNAYRSIHLGINYRNYIIEVQIRTKEMDFIAEYGQAAHWVYKDRSTSDEKYREFYNNLKHQLDTLGDGIGHDIIERDRFLNLIHIWTPDKARSHALIKGATPLDFAFYIHTELGLQCIGAYVNGNYVPLDYELQNGDTVNIRKHPSQKPSIDWFNIVKTNRARTKLTHYFRNLKKQESIRKGKEMLLKEFKKNKLNFNKWIKQQEAPSILSSLKLDPVDPNKLLEIAGNGTFRINRLINAIIGKEETDTKTEKEHGGISFDSTNDTVIIDGMSNIHYKIAKCCNPIPGDEVTGYITMDHIISIHRKDCTNTFGLESCRMLSVNFVKGNDGFYNLFLHIETKNDMDIYTRIVSIISGDRINISKSSNVKVKSPEEDVRHIDLHLKVLNISQIKRIFPRISNVEGVLKVQRKASAENI